MNFCLYLKRSIGFSSYLKKEDEKNSTCLFCFNRMDGVGILLESPSVCFVLPFFFFSFVGFGLSVENTDGVLLYESECIQVTQV